MNNNLIATRAPHEIPASRPGPISIVVLLAGLSVVLLGANWTLVKGWFA